MTLVGPLHIRKCTGLILSHILSCFEQINDDDDDNNLTSNNTFIFNSFILLSCFMCCTLFFIVHCSLLCFTSWRISHSSFKPFIPFHVDHFPESHIHFGPCPFRSMPTSVLAHFGPDHTHFGPKIWVQSGYGPKWVGAEVGIQRPDRYLTPHHLHTTSEAWWVWLTNHTIIWTSHFTRSNIRTSAFYPRPIIIAMKMPGGVSQNKRSHPF